MFEAYSVAVRVSLINNATTGLMGIASAFAKAHGNAVALQGQLDKIKGALLAGGALAGTGLFGLSLIEKTVPAAREYAHQIQQMNVAGMKQVEIAKAVKAAWGSAKDVPTASATENLKAIREFRMVFGDTQHAIANMATVQKLQAVLANTNNGHGGNYGDQAYTVAKALEMRGATLNPAMFNQQADLMTKAIIASGGKVGPQDFLSNIIYGRRAAYGWDNTFTYSILPTLIQEMKGSGGGGARGPGNALMSAYAAVVGGTVPQKALKVWDSLGLIDKSKVEWTKAGEMKGVRPGGIVGADIFQANPYAWAQTVLLPAMKSRGITDPAKVRETMQYLFPNRTASIMDQMVTQAWKFERDKNLIQGAQGLSGYYRLLQKDPKMAEVAFHQQWNNVKTQLGLQVLPMLIVATQKATVGLSMMARAMEAHPKLTKALVVGFTALAGAMAISGTVILIGTAFSMIGIAAPIVAAGVGALAAAIGAISAPVMVVVGAVAVLGVALFNMAKHWDTSKGVLENIRAEIGMFFSWIGEKVKSLLGFLPVGMRPATAADVAAAKSRPWSAPVTAGQPLFDLTPRGLAPKPSTQFGQAGSTLPAFVKPSSAPAKPAAGDVYLDAKKVGKVVWNQGARDMDRASRTGGGGIDPGLNLSPVGARYA